MSVEQSVSMFLSVLLETMLCLLLLELNNSWSMIFIRFSSMGDHAPSFITRVKQQVEHGFTKFYGKRILLNSSWSMVSVSYIGKHARHGLCHI